MSIRPYTDEDQVDLLDVWYQASLIAHSFLSREFLDNERSQIATQWLPVAKTTVYETEGRVVGFLSLVDNEVGGLFVHPDHQRRGIGRALMDHARRTRPFLELDVFAANTSGRAFYDSYGFELVDRHINQDTGQPELRLRLSNESHP